MPAAAFISSICTGVCTGHPTPINVSGVIVTGAGTKLIEGNAAARVGDLVLASCGHYGVIASGQNMEVEGVEQSAVGDTFSGTFSGTISSGSATENIGG